MTSLLTQLVPVLTGPNYKQWAPQMTNYLRSQDIYDVCIDAIPEIIFDGQWLKEEGKKDQWIMDKSVDPQNIKELRAFATASTKAVGAMNLRLHPNIMHKYSALTNAKLLWTALEKEYGKPGIASTYYD